MQGIVKIIDIAREAGGRTKIAVASNDDSIDPVGACVGLKGSRVQAVVSELSGERIDIVPWHPDPEIYAKRALAPAKVAKVISDQERKVITAIVDEDQLSLAIGRNGQNVRLASQLIGWQIDLYSSREWMERGAESALFSKTNEEYETADFPLSELEILPAVLAALEAAGYSSFMGIIDLERKDLLRINGIGPEEADTLVQLIEELTIVEEPEELPEEAPAEAVPVASGLVPETTSAEETPGEAEEGAVTAAAEGEAEPDGEEVTASIETNGESVPEQPVTADESEEDVEEEAPLATDEPVAEVDTEAVAGGERDA